MVVLWIFVFFYVEWPLALEILSPRSLPMPHPGRPHSYVPIPHPGRPHSYGPMPHPGRPHGPRRRQTRLLEQQRYLFLDQQRYAATVLAVNARNLALPKLKVAVLYRLACAMFEVAPKRPFAAGFHIGP